MGRIVNDWIATVEVVEVAFDTNNTVVESA
jgi:hypothetical protein